MSPDAASAYSMRAQSDYELMSDGLLGCQQPGRPAELGVSCQAHMVHRKDKLLVGLRHGFEAYALDSNIAFEQDGLGSVVWVVPTVEFFELFLNLHEGQVPLEAFVRGDL